MPLPPGVKLDGDKLHVELVGRPEQETATGELNAAPWGVTLTVNVPAWPCLMVAGFGLIPTAKSMPTPDRLTVCGLPEALSVTLSTADAVPADAGAK